MPLICAGAGWTARACLCRTSVTRVRASAGPPCLTVHNSIPDKQLFCLLCLCVQGRPVYIQLLGKIDIGTLKQITTEERMIKFHIQEYERCGKVIMPVCSRLAGRQIDQTFGIMDVKGE